MFQIEVFWDTTTLYQLNPSCLHSGSIFVTSFVALHCLLTVSIFNHLFVGKSLQTDGKKCLGVTEYQVIIAIILLFNMCCNMDRVVVESSQYLSIVRTAAKLNSMYTYLAYSQSGVNAGSESWGVCGAYCQKESLIVLE